MEGVVLGYRAIWHDRGPGGRHDFSGRSRGRGHPQPQTGLDRKWRVGPHPTLSRPERHPNFNHSYILSAYVGALQHIVTIIADY